MNPFPQHAEAGLEKHRGALGALETSAGGDNLFQAGLGETFDRMLCKHQLSWTNTPPDPDNRTVLAVCSATRHVGIAVIVAAPIPGPETAALIGAPPGRQISS